MSAPALALFPVEAIPRPRPAAPPGPVAAPRCTWHRGDELPPATHRLIVAINLLHPCWWRDYAPGRTYMVGTAICAEHAARGGSGLWGDEMVQHFIPLDQEIRP
ncbi:hypothetical protein [Streptomyces sp. NRRL F-5123]|uniref:hypothetical protein n=1 Tax=Streptomyces sp. NRRL F-5123 TaxID=1463856 RepID=UPI0004E14BF1|nr:hypothetical protein [Streptomyces sp. NRRL F-5123]